MRKELAVSAAEQYNAAAMLADSGLPVVLHANLKHCL
jgi:hypothetical protein